MEIKRQNDIIAFREKSQAPVAFHARNLEVAEISEELWLALGQTHTHESQKSEAEDALLAWNEEINPQTKTASISNGISSLSINVTQICNLKCSYCAAGGDGTYGDPQFKISIEKTLPQLKYFLTKAADNQKFKIVFIGGEPLLHPDGILAIGKYVQEFANKNAHPRNIIPQFGIVTNGTLFTEKNIDILKELKCQVTVSIDGPEKINDVSRPFKNGNKSTKVVTEGLRELFKSKNELGPIILHGVFTKDNLNIIEAFDFYSEFPAEKFEFSFDVHNSTEETSDLFCEQMKAIGDKALSESGETGLRKISFFDKIFTALDDQVRIENFCGAGKSLLVIDAKNKIFTCPWDVGKKDTLVGEDLSLNESALNTYSRPLIELNDCQQCWARYLCGGGCMYIHEQATGSKNIKSDIFCNRMRTLVMTGILFYKKCRNFEEGTSNEN